MKDFAGGLLVIMGANSGPGLRSMPLRMVLQDEIDAYPDDVDGEGDPCVLADKRTDQFARAKRFKCGSPKVKGKSRITRRYEAGSQARYHVPCPQCKALQWLKWGQMRWAMVRRRELACPECGGIGDVDLAAAGPHACQHCKAMVELGAANTRELDTAEVERAWYECEACGGEIDEHHKTAMMEEWPAGLARHIHETPGPGQVIADDDPDPHAIWARVRGELRRFRPKFTRALSWHVSALYSPLGWFSWAKAVKQYLDAKKGGYDEETGESLEQVFYNTVLGEAYEVSGEQPKVNVLRQRAEGYEQAKVPMAALMLVASVDVQGDRLEVEFDAFGEGEECWVVDFHVIAGDPTKHGPGSVWAALAALREKAYPHESGHTMRALAMAVDSGYLTQDVYDFCRRYAHRHVIATKGDGAGGKPILARPAWVDVDHRGQKIKRGVQLWHVGTDTAKERLYKRLEIAEAGPGYQHLPRWLPDEYFEQLTAEKLVRRLARGIEKHEWIKMRERNEALDLKILCYAAAVHAGLQRTNWAQLRAVYSPEQRDLFVQSRQGPRGDRGRDREPRLDHPAGDGRIHHRHARPEVRYAGHARRAARAPFEIQVAGRERGRAGEDRRRPAQSARHQHPIDREVAMLMALRTRLSRLIAPKGKAVGRRMFHNARPRLSGLTSTNSSADQESVTSLRNLRSYSRQLTRDASFAKRAKVVVVNNVIGSGIGLQSQVKTTRGDAHATVNKAIEEAFEEWCRADSCHTGGGLHFHDFERALMSEVFEAGEVFVRLHYQKFGESQVPLALELVEAERLADDVVPGNVATPGNMIRMGVEVDKFYRPVAYWIRERHVGEFRFGADETNRYERVAASEIIHLRVAERWPQTRGTPWLHSVIRKLQDIDGYSEAEIVAARAAASYVWWIKSADDPHSPLAEEKSDGTQEMAVEPGMAKRLAPGEDIIANTPNRPNSAMDPFMRMMLREVAAGCGPSYESLSRDYSQSNYSSSRLALLDDRDLWRVVQKWFIRSFREPVHRVWLQQAVLARAIASLDIGAYASDTSRYCLARFKPRGWTWIDPSSDLDAYEKAVRCGFTTVSQVVQQTAEGMDLEDVLEQRRLELDQMAELGLEFDTDPKRLSDGKIAAQVGSASAAQTANAGGADPNASPSVEPAATAPTAEQKAAEAAGRIFRVAMDAAMQSAERIFRTASEGFAEVARSQKPPQALVSVAPPAVTVKAGDVHVAPAALTVNPGAVNIEVQPAAAPAVTVENRVEPTPIEVKVAAPAVRIDNRVDVPAPQVTVEAPQVTVEAPHVTVGAPEVRIDNHIVQETETVTRHKRDEHGELVESVAKTRVAR
jgi:lambda family phage portal protein